MFSNVKRIRDQPVSSLLIHPSFVEACLRFEWFSLLNRCNLAHRVRFDRPKNLHPSCDSGLKCMNRRLAEPIISTISGCLSMMGWICAKFRMRRRSYGLEYVLGHSLRFFVLGSCFCSCVEMTACYTPVLAERSTMMMLTMFVVMAQHRASSVVVKCGWFASSLLSFRWNSHMVSSVGPLKVSLFGYCWLALKAFWKLALVVDLVQFHWMRWLGEVLWRQDV